MGRVFDAMRRHSATDNGTAAKATRENQSAVTTARAVTGLPSAEQIEEQLLSGSSIMSVPGQDGAKFSVHCAHCGCTRRVGTPRRNSFA